MEYLKLSDGTEVMLDAEDYNFFSRWKWQLSPSGYVARSAQVCNIRKRVYLHRLIMECPSNKVVDHIDKNRLNNQKLNLRVCTTTQNIVGASGSLKSEVKYKGVSYAYFNGIKVLTKYRARINDLNLGCFDNPVDAAIAYDKKAFELYGIYAYQNFPERG